MEGYRASLGRIDGDGFMRSERQSATTVAADSIAPRSDGREAPRWWLSYATDESLRLNGLPNA
jgi:hypothetical protein